MTTTSRWTRGAPRRPLRIVLYGPGGIGKTTTAACAPGAVVLRTEDGLGTLDVPASPIAESYADVVAALEELFTMEPGTLVVDSLDWLEPLIWAETASRANKADIEAFGYGKGYIAAADLWREFLAGLAALNDRGWSIILIAHERVRRFDDPSSESYDRYELKLHDRASALVVEWADVVGFCHWETLVRDRENGRGSKTRAIGTGNRLVATQRTPAWEAKSRFPLPAVVRMDPEILYPALLDAGAVLPIPAETATTTAEG